MDRHAQDWGGEVSILRCHVTVTAWVLAMSTLRIVRTQRSKRNEMNLRSACVTLYRGPGGDGSDDDVESRMEPRSSAACLSSVERYCTVIVSLV
jgi:hypothetical protein